MRETIAVGLVLPFGSLDDSIKGMNHFVEHLLFNSPVAKNFLKIFDEKGILYNGVTSYEYMLFYCHGLKKDRQLMVDFCKSIISNFEITQDEFEKEKKVVLSEIEYYSHNQIETISNMLIGYNKCIAILGSKESIASVTRLNIVNYVNFIKKSYSIVDSDGEIISKIGRNRKLVKFLGNKSNLIKVINNLPSSFSKFYGIGISTSKNTSQYLKVLIDAFYDNLNDEFRERRGLTYRVLSKVVQTDSYTQNQFIFSVANDVNCIDVLRSITEIFEKTKQDVLSLTTRELEKYLIRLETKSDIKLDNKLGRMKLNALKKIYIDDIENDSLSLQGEIEELNGLTIAIFNIEEKDIREECKDFSVEFIEYGGN